MGYIGNGPYQGVLTGGNIQDGTVDTADLKDGSVTAAKLAEGAVTDPTPAVVSDTNNTSTGYFDLPAGTTAQRPITPNVGYVRYNTTLGFLEQYTADGWQGIAPLSVRVSAGSGLNATLENAISIDETPVWSTPSGVVGTVYEDQAMSTLTVTATDPEGSTVSYAIASGALPTGLTLASNGEITGTPNAGGTYNASGINHNFGVNASDGTGNTTLQNFTIVRKWLDGTTEAQAASSGTAIRNLGITDDGTYWIKPTSGAASQVYVINSIHGGGWVKFAQYYNNAALNGTSALNSNGGWAQQKGGFYAGKLSHADIHALQSAGTNTEFGFTIDHGGSNGKYRYWRYVEGSTTSGHHPRVSRIGIRDSDGNDHDIKVYTSDNCSDVGTYQVGTTSTYDHGSQMRASTVYVYHSTTATRGANFTLQGSNDGSSWTNVMSGNMTAYVCGITFATSVDYPGTNSTINLDPFLNFGNGMGFLSLTSGNLANFGTNVQEPGTYKLQLDYDSNGTIDDYVTYTQDSRAVCSHSTTGLWYQDHNYNGTPTTVKSRGMEMCYTLGTNYFGTNLHWMSVPYTTTGGGRSDGELLWGSGPSASASLWIK
jgi:hypothetical protein